MFLTFYLCNDAIHLHQTPIKKVLYITHQNPDLESGDYQSDMTLVGLTQLLGHQSVTEFPLHRAVHKTLEEFALPDAQRFKKNLYGGGYVQHSYIFPIDTLVFDLLIFYIVWIVFRGR